MLWLNGNGLIKRAVIIYCLHFTERRHLYIMPSLALTTNPGAQKFSFEVGTANFLIVLRGPVGPLVIICRV